jgi:hypothetical protein
MEPRTDGAIVQEVGILPDEGPGARGSRTQEVA